MAMTKRTAEHHSRWPRRLRFAGRALFESLERRNLLHGDGFDLAPTVAYSGSGQTSITADVDNDNDVDLITGSWSSFVVVSLNSGNGAFDSRKTYNVSGSPGYLAAADVNHDGYVDLISANQYGNSVSV